jgi:zinc-RING finger domain
MECKICVKAYASHNQPQVLLCGHTICEFCLNNLSITSFTCPFDRLDLVWCGPNYQLIYLLKVQNKYEAFSADPGPDKGLCPSKHILSLTLKPESGVVQCNECRRVSKSSSWHCRACNYDVCPRCKGDILCPESHIMTKTDPSSFKCDGCLKLKDQESLSCRKCDTDLCTACYKKLKFSSAYKNFCKRGHLMKWRNCTNKLYSLISDKKYYVCDRCSKRFFKIGSMNCLDCRADRCIACI